MYKMKERRKMRQDKKITNSSNGITLIALVITIIVLLILAAVSIATLTGENGLLTKAGDAKTRTEKAEAEEQVKLAVLGSYGNNGEIDIGKLNSNLEQIEGLTSGIPVTKLPATVTVNGYEVTIDENGNVSISDKGNGGNGSGGDTATLPSNNDTKPFLPTEDSTIVNNDLSTGVVIKDSNNNEWVWVEVPKSIYTTATSNTDYANIEKDMQTYASAYRSSRYTDTWYSEEQHGFSSSNDYNNYKNNMLKSVYDNGGFYIGRYEVGTQTARFSKDDELTTPIIQQDAYPYNYVTCKQAQSLSNQLATGGNTSSLMFGIQWDLVLKYIETKGGKIQDELKSDSITWGNYHNATFTITRGSYNTSPDTVGSWSKVNSSYTKPSSSVLLTTGAIERNSVLNIYDLAGNVWEWTLEYTSSTGFPSCNRGGYYFDDGNYGPASYRSNGSTSGSDHYVGLRSALY